MSGANQPRRPLRGLRVLDLSRVLAGPYCTQLLADQGADVIKLEGPSGDENRLWGARAANGVTCNFNSVNRGIMTALFNRDRGAGGDWVRVSLLETAISLLGADTEPILRDELGYDAARIERLREGRAI